MPTVNDYLVQLQKDKQNLVKAFSDRGVEASSSDTFTSLASKSGGLPTGGGGKPVKTDFWADVIFIDIDGTVLYSFTKEEFLSLTDMPEGVPRENLIPDGWNWSFSGAQEYVRKYGRLVVGQIYKTVDDATYIYIELNDKRKAPYLGICINGTITIEWGDGTSEEATGTNVGNPINKIHEYQTGGKYIIKIIPHENCQMAISGNANTYSYLLWGNNAGVAYTVNASYQCAVKQLYIGKGLYRISSYGMQTLQNLEAFSISRNLTYFASTTFRDCTSLKAVIMNNEATTVNTAMFRGCSSIKVVSLGETSKTYSSMFDTCVSLKRICLPRNATDIPNSFCNSCTQLEEIIIPDGVISMGSNALYSYTMLNIELPDGMTTLSTALTNMRAMGEIKVPPSVGYLSSTTFQNCRSLAIVDFTRSTKVVTASGANTFQYCPDDMKIVVPKDLYMTWKEANYWSTWASKIWYIDDNGEYSQVVL